MASSPFSTLYLCIHSAQNVQMKSRYAYCKTFVANKPMVENTMFAAVSSTRFQSFKTSAVRMDNHQPVWKAKFEVRVNDPRVDVLSVLVKSRKLLCCLIVGVCVITLKNLIGAGLVDRWFALHKVQRQTGHIRLQMLLEKIENPTISPHQECPPNPVPSQHEQPNRVTLVEDVYRHLNREKRERRQRIYHEAANQGVDSDNQEVPKKTALLTTKQMHLLGHSFTISIKFDWTVTKRSNFYILITMKEARVSSHVAVTVHTSVAAVAISVTLVNRLQLVHRCLMLSDVNLTMIFTATTQDLMTNFTTAFAEGVVNQPNTNTGDNRWQSPDDSDRKGLLNPQGL